MSSLPTPNYVLNQRVEHRNGFTDSFILEAGAFVRPIDERWVPKHVLEDPRWQDKYKKALHIFCYTHYGIIMVPRDALRQV